MHTFDKEHISQTAKDLGLKAKFNSDTPGIKNTQTGELIEFSHIAELFTDDSVTIKEKTNMKRQFAKEIEETMGVTKEALNKVYDLQDKVYAIETEFNSVLGKIEFKLEDIKSEVEELYDAEDAQEANETTDSIIKQLNELLDSMF